MISVFFLKRENVIGFVFVLRTLGVLELERPLVGDSKMLFRVEIAFWPNLLNNALLSLKPLFFVVLGIRLPLICEWINFLNKVFFSVSKFTMHSSIERLYFSRSPISSFIEGQC